jgi:hypothetical protein
MAVHWRKFDEIAARERFSPRQRPQSACQRGEKACIVSGNEWPPGPSEVHGISRVQDIIYEQARAKT